MPIFKCLSGHYWKGNKLLVCSIDKTPIIGTITDEEETRIEISAQENDCLNLKCLHKYSTHHQGAKCKHDNCNCQYFEKLHIV